MTLKPIDELSQLGIIEMRRKADEVASQAFKWMPWLSGRVSIRVGGAIRRAYRQGHLTKSIDELTDKELLSAWQIGPKALEQIRRAIAKEQDTHTTLNSEQ